MNIIKNGALLIIAMLLPTIAIAMANVTQTPANNCGKSDLTQEQFLDMIHTIAMHGDLTDIPFIEKTLQTKFTSHDESKNGTTYTIKSYHGTPIEIALSNYESPNHNDWMAKSFPKVLARISFGWQGKNSANFHDCGYLIKNMFDHKFAAYSIEPEELYDVLGGPITDQKSVPDPNIIKNKTITNTIKMNGYSGANLTHVAGKYGAITNIDYHFEPNNGIVYYITIQQMVY